MELHLVYDSSWLSLAGGIMEWNCISQEEWMARLKAERENAAATKAKAKKTTVVIGDIEEYM